MRSCPRRLRCVWTRGGEDRSSTSVRDSSSFASLHAHTALDTAPDSWLALVVPPGITEIWRALVLARVGASDCRSILVHASALASDRCRRARCCCRRTRGTCGRSAETSGPVGKARGQITSHHDGRQEDAAAGAGADGARDLASVVRGETERDLPQQPEEYRSGPLRPAAAGLPCRRGQHQRHGRLSVRRGALDRSF